MNIFKAMYEVGQRSGLNLSEDFKARKDSWTLELTTGALTLMTRTLEVPLQRKRSSDAPTKPRYYYDTAQYVLNPRAYFWTLHQEAFRQDPDPELLKATERLLKKGLPTLPEAAEKNWILLTYKGEPLITRPALREFHKAYFLKGEGNSSVDTCMITGAVGQVGSLHPDSSWKGVPCTLFSVNIGAVRYNGAPQAANFPVSSEAGAFYSQGLTRQLNRGSLFFGTDHCITMWPEGQLDHDIIDLTVKLFAIPNSANLKAMPDVWAAIEALTDDTHRIHLITMRKNKKRLAVQTVAQMTAGDLAKNLLRFREEFEGLADNGFRRTFPMFPNKIGDFSFQDQRDIGWAVLTGTPFPKTVLPRFMRLPLEAPNAHTKNFHVNRFQLQWITAVRFRTIIKPPKRTPMPAETDYERIVAKYNRKVDETNQDPAYIHGRIVAAYQWLRSQANKKNAPMRESVNGMLKTSTSITKMRPEIYEEALRRGNRGYDDVHFFRALFAQQQVVSSKPFTQMQHALARLGYQHQQIGFDETNREYWAEKHAKDAAREALTAGTLTEGSNANT